jgi:hypothetical protein
MSMTYRTLDLQLNVDNRGRSHGESAYRWFSILLDELAGSELADLADLPAVTRLDPYSDMPQGEPGALYGFVEVAQPPTDIRRTRERRNLSTDGWAWLRAELNDIPYNAPMTIQIGRISPGGVLGGIILKAGLLRLEKSPDWLVLDAAVPAQSFLDPSTGAMKQRRWLKALRRAADQLNPGFGHIEYWRGRERTALERYSTAPGTPVNQRKPPLSIRLNRQRLRGYSWLTILSEEVATRLGGASALAATGSFLEVEPLAEGGLWLLATEDFRDWAMPAAEAVFRAVAPALPSGAPIAPRPDQDPPPTFLVLDDPST